MRFAVLGPGGIGGLMAALLARAGDSVEVLAGESTARQIADGGIRVESMRFGDFTAAVQAAPQLSDPVDAVLVTVKATQLEDAMKRVPPTSLRDALVIPFLNGLEHVEVMRRVYPPEQVVPGTIRIESTRIGPGLIRHTTQLAGIEIGPAAEQVGAHLRAAGFDVRIRADEKVMLWEKFVFLAPMALLTTDMRANVDGVRTKRRKDLTALLQEVCMVARADGVPIDPAAILRFIDAAPGSMETSMQRDQAAGRPLELDALGGALLRRAEAAGIDTPVTRRLVAEIQDRSPASKSA
jgi:2-dehydropantoate 2-reductase